MSTKTRAGYAYDSATGKVEPAPVLDSNMKHGQHDDEFRTMEDFYSPNLDRTVAEILRETEELRYTGNLKPFVEGEPIGKLPKYRIKKQQKETVQQIAKRMHRQRDEMLQLRAANNAAMRRVLNP